MQADLSGDRATGHIDRRVYKQGANGAHDALSLLGLTSGRVGLSPIYTVFNPAEVCS
jgi:hypothetical protein